MASIPAPASNGTGTTSKPRASATASSLPSSGKKRKDAVPTFGIMWPIMRSIGDVSLPLFFSSLQISSPHVVPSSNTPVIVCSNHSNTILDVAILASHYPERRPLHFWAKAGFFTNAFSRFILTSSGNIKVDRRNKNNQSLFEGTFEAMKAGGAIALFPEGGSYTIPKLAKLKMGAAWAALEYSRYLQLQEGEAKTAVKILPTAVVFDDKSVFRSRAVLKFGEPISLDRYIGEFLSAPSPEEFASKNVAARVSGIQVEDGTVPATPESMTRTNTSQGGEAYASPAHRAVARLTADLEKALQELTFNAPDWETFQSVRLARELIFELHSDKEVREDMTQYVELSRALMTLLTLHSRKSVAARRALFTYSSMLNLCDVDNLTLARTIPLSSSRAFWSPLKSFLLRLPIYAPIYSLTLIPTYLLPNALAHHYAGREEESLSSVKTLFGWLFTTMLYSTLVVRTMAWARWSPPGLLVGLAGVWWLHDLNRSCIDGAYGLVKRVRFGWRVWRAGVSPSSVAPVKAEEHKGRSLFFYGTLVHPKILSRVIGNDGSHLKVQNAVLDGARLYHVKNAEYPGLLKEPSTSSSVKAVKGTLVSGLTLSDVQRLDAFEGDEYTRSLVSVLPDPAAPIETNATRIANAGNAPLHAILAGLTPNRIAELVSSEGSKVDAEVYTWSAGRDKLEDKVWEFDAFARTHAHNWVGEGPVEHEHEYQLVDRVVDRLAAETTATIINPTPPEEEGDAWVDAYVKTLIEGDGREDVGKVCRMLLEKPSIQWFVDRTFAKGQRPRKGDRNMLRALFRARAGAKLALQELISAVEEGDGEVREALELLVEAKRRALAKVGAHLTVDSGWPFTPTQLETFAGVERESKKTI
ncbi:AIG2-like protein [Kalmanozyma brasiliensis GHG001]|uniref:Phospholipid/glycerol acyltransferase domain-containing protein n=1 Tax=Kalmanozyma brasiliensis (strain GHG001) TaxID=1365824 RepID=V5ETT7_KALBG|nr:AIG2-like protein [Kalmanozyma brasiliensis GHG001]EST08705.1 AIG2-like protein [Kalmanozyma brasiliensis GHG001]